MKMIEKRSIGGYVFPLETDAFNKINEYLHELNEYYSLKQGGNEIMDGIEDRMGELLLERCGQDGVVNEQNVAEVIAVLGRPEAIEEETSESDPQDKKTVAPQNRKRLYRNMADRRIGGVCGGLGTYFDIDPTIFRLIFVTASLMMVFLYHILWRHFYLSEEFCYFLFPTVYAILWVCMPAAKTVRQKDELHGELGTVDAISERVRRERNKPENIKKYDTWPKVERILLACVGIILMIGGICAISAMGTALLNHDYIYYKALENVHVGLGSDLHVHLIEPLNSAWGLASVSFLILVPFVLMLYWGILLAFGLKAPKWRPGLILFLLWLAALTAMAVYVNIYITSTL